MQFSIQKNITQKKRSPFKGTINVMILVIAVPVIIIAAISLSVYFFFLWLKDKVMSPTINVPAEDHYHLELDLIHNERIHIIMIEDESDIELTKLNEAWQEKVYNDETCLYRIKTVPAIPGLEAAICCFYYREESYGLFLQIVPARSIINSASLDSQLFFLDYNTFTISLIDTVGPFFLYNDEKDTQLIKGFNKKEKMEIRVVEH